MPPRIGFTPSDLFWSPTASQGLSSIGSISRPNGTFYNPSIWSFDQNIGPLTTILMSDTRWSLTLPTFVGGFISGSGTWTVARREATTSIPETTPVAGLLILGWCGLMVKPRR
ncbi:MAG: hypothetical protein HC825_02535 [Oscillatoriales cyanobacterium RM1_1_9]|nr:hypothetical protein [Oscillatoriales cyanobacterium SM2_3_0]NJO44246.1 hypothetical protein [Oscillatoriales cyanobacterium RM2_1_1]NJO70870.1 hypothetical protein [Oscillatoriales cyanobacterium RM1_1_9]